MENLHKKTISVENEGHIKAIVVDDEPVIKDIVATLLEMEGYSVSSFENSLEALKHARDKEYDIIVTDYFMPGINGIELIQKIKEVHPYIASVLITGVGSEQTVIDAFTKGNVNSYVTKPFNNEELLRILRLAVKEQKIKLKEDKFHTELKSQIKEATKQLKEKNKQLMMEEKKTKTLYKKVKDEQTIIKQTNRLLQRLSITDGLTGLYNQRYFQKRIKEEFIRAKRYNLPFSCLMMDLDDFKKINDTYGHQIGDRILIEFARILTDSIRNIDMAIRYGGEEFIALLPQINIAGAVKVAERFRRRVESYKFKEANRPLTTTVSIGVVSYPMNDIKTEKDLLKAADTSLYMAKNSGKNRVVAHTKEREKSAEGGKILTSSEKKEILSKIIKMLNRSIGIDKILKTFLNKIREVYDSSDTKMMCSITLIGKDGKPCNFVSIGENKNYRDKIMGKAKEVFKNRKMQIYRPQKNERVFSSIPLITDAGTEKERVIGVLSISSAVEDMDFIGDIANLLSIAIKNVRA
ncbi:MAG: hypothetical protein A3I04_01225 [Nitrospinae bacterium RIFCSPLOWO2_02_FULL_39_110]|nr:MAG: hypothetical protein A2Z59_13090 [Nitrospinae bacterium RIFCSPLOWO2_02_39_17]OGW05105.1 MAG: hypothetical protein A3I04_01225 [Nitrospinae bacterium RIFCSPLOWO2_02_FULL_39_110]